MNENKKVLLIMPNFFDYPQLITQELNSMGYDVDYFDDRPSTKGIIKAIIRVKKDLISNYIEKYFNSILETVKSKKYDVFLLISGQSLSFTKEMLLKIKELQPNTEFVLYQWDAMSNFEYIQNMHDLFDRKYSFDRNDCNKNKDLHFLPLFFSNKYRNIGSTEVKDFKYDFCFVGTAHPKKYKFIKLMTEQLADKYKNMFVYFFFPSKLVYYYRKLKNPEFKKAKKSEFHFIPVKGKEMDELITNSRCILDSPQGGQLGLTIRVLEALGAKRKLITTNSDVKNYDFYKEQNIYIYDGSFDFESVFFKEDYCDIPDDIYEKYSIRSWLNELIG